MKSQRPRAQRPKPARAAGKRSSAQRPSQSEGRARKGNNERSAEKQPGRSQAGRGGAARTQVSSKTRNRRDERSQFAERRKQVGARVAREEEHETKLSARPKPISGELDKARLERVPYPKLPQALSQLKGPPHPGQWILATREGSEQDLVDELMLAKVIDPAPRMLAPGLVLAPKVPKRDKRAIDLTFARQGFELLIHARAPGLDELASRLERSLRNKLTNATQYALHVWVADTPAGNPLSALAEELETAIASMLKRSLFNAKRVDDASLRRLGSIPFAQVCLLDPESAVAGVMHSNATPSLARGGRTRVRVTGEFPSRAARKLEEALAWLGVEPGPGDVCVDLGAAPGGWTYVLAERRARVIAVNPANLRPDILAKKGVKHLKESAFTFTPEEPIDWLFCDMAWRPLEAAALLAKWGRKRWARMIVANIKLPMKKKAEILARIRAILETEGEWNGLRFKQLYHDREEITLTAHRA